MGYEVGGSTIISSITIAPAVGGDVSMTAGLIWVGVNGWEYEANYPPLDEPCQSPVLSLNLAYNNYLNPGHKRPCGDCDDFAVMLAYFIQEHAHFDTCVALHEGTNGRAEHAACLIRYEPDALDDAEALGWGYTHTDSQGRHWWAIDMRDDTGTIPAFHPAYMNNPYVPKEWYELVGKPDGDFGLVRNSP